MFTEQTLSGQKRQVRPQGTDEEVEAIRQKAVKLKLFIYNKQVHDSIIKMLKAGQKTPIATIGKIAAEIITKFEKDGAGIINDPDVLEGLSKALIREIMTLAAASNILTKEQVNAQTLFSIVGVAQAQWDKMNPERADKGRSQRLMEEGKKNPVVQDAVNRNAQAQGMRSRQAPAQQAAPAMPQEQM